jgi:microcystin-dependent protein
MDPILGQIIETAFDWTMSGWARCEGQLLSVQQNAALFSLLVNQYGGDGHNTFALPDLRPRDETGRPLPWERGKPVKQIALVGMYPMRD